MKDRLVRSPKLLIISLLTLFCSCNRQNASHDGSYQVVARGETVEEVGVKALVIFQDKNNDFWFGGNEKGVYWYNGTSLVLITKKDGLCHHSVLGIQEDHSGNIYFDTPEGVSKFDGQSFTTLEIADENASTNEWQLAPEDLWFRMGWGRKGPYRYDGKYLHYLPFPKPEMEDEFYAKYPNVSYSPYGIYSIYKDRQGAIWFGTSSLGVCRFDGKSISWLYEQHLTDTPEGGSFGIRSIIEDKDGYFWFCNTRHRYEILPALEEKDGASYLTYNKEDGVGNKEGDFPYFMSVVKDNEGDLWMATYEEGVYRKKGSGLIHYPIKDGETDVLLFSIYKDNQGDLWLGTHNAGVYKFNGNGFEKFKIS